MDPNVIRLDSNRSQNSIREQDYGVYYEPYEDEEYYANQTNAQYYENQGLALLSLTIFHFKIKFEQLMMIFSDHRIEETLTQL